MMGRGWLGAPPFTGTLKGIEGAAELLELTRRPG